MPYRDREARALPPPLKPKRKRKTSLVPSFARDGWSLLARSILLLRDELCPRTILQLGWPTNRNTRQIWRTAVRYPKARRDPASGQLWSGRCANIGCKYRARRRRAFSPKVIFCGHPMALNFPKNHNQPEWPMTVAELVLVWPGACCLEPSRVGASWNVIRLCID